MRELPFSLNDLSGTTGGLTLLHFQMTQHNVGALVVVKPGKEKAIAGIITERGNQQFSSLRTFYDIKAPHNLT